MLKIRNEIKIGLLAIVALGLGLWGFKFLKGINVLSSNKIYYAKYDNVNELRPSSNVYINGLQVGTVSDIYIDDEDDKTIIVEMTCEGDVDVPKNARAIIAIQGIMGGSAVKLEFDAPCEGDDCAQSGDYLNSGSQSFVESLVGDPAQLDVYMQRLQVGLTTIYDSIADPRDPKGVGRTLLALHESLANIAIMTAKINKMLDESSSGFSETANNLAAVTGAIRKNNDDITLALTNLAEMSEQLKNADLGKSADKANTALDSITSSVSALKTTLVSTESAISKVDSLAQGLIAGEGSAGMLLNDPELYNNLVRTSRQIQLLMQDLRLNPKRYNTVKLKVFGKNKQPEYQNPLDDPAYQMLIDSLERDYSDKVRN